MSEHRRKFSTSGYETYAAACDSYEARILKLQGDVAEAHSLAIDEALKEAK